MAAAAILNSAPMSILSFDHFCIVVVDSCKISKLHLKITSGAVENDIIEL